MKKALFVVLLFLCAWANAEGDFWSSVTGTASDVGNFFSKQFNNFKDLFANDKDQLKQNVEKVESLLKGIQNKLSDWNLIANDQQKAALAKVGDWLRDIETFKNKVQRDGGQNFNNLKTEWERKLKTMFEDGNLQSVMTLVNSGDRVATSLMCVVGVMALHAIINRN